MLKRVVVVEDTPEQTEILSEYLHIMGYDSISFKKPQNAIEHICHKQADLVLMDQKLSCEMDGLDAVKEIKKVKPGQKIIMMSGYNFSDFVDSESEVDGFLRKPFLFSELKDVFNGVLAEDK